MGFVDFRDWALDKLGLVYKGHYHALDKCFLRSERALSEARRRTGALERELFCLRRAAKIDIRIHEVRGLRLGVVEMPPMLAPRFDMAPSENFSRRTIALRPYAAAVTMSPEARTATEYSEMRTMAIRELALHLAERMFADAHELAV